jgi:MoaE-MoaD fusion protein
MAEELITVLYFGILKELAGREREMLFVTPGMTVELLLHGCGARFPKIQPYLPSIAVSINQEFATRNSGLKSGDEVGLLPPVSGGSDKPEPFVRIIRERIVPHDIVPPLERPEDGAVVIFDGVVRNHSRGRRTLYLEYESYEQMAVKQLRELAAQSIAQFGVRNAAIVHRLGRIEIGESSVLIAVFSAHRAAAFDACRFLIDRLKQTVPIWKKEFFEGGAVWADGEPFPPGIATSPSGTSSSE